MKILDYFSRKNKQPAVTPQTVEQRDSVRDLLRQELSLLRYTDSGVPVNHESAMAYTAVYACVNIISSAFASLPVKVFDGEGNPVAHPIRKLLQIEPNSIMTPATFRDVMMVNLLLFGNAYAIISRDAMGDPVSLMPVASPRVRVEVSNARLRYLVRNGESGQETPYSQSRMLHIKNISFTGVEGISPLEKLRNTIGLGLAAEKLGSKFFANGMNLSGILKLPAGMTDPQKIDAFVQQWKEKNTGAENAFRVAVGLDGMDFMKTSVTPEESEMLDTRVHQVREVARVYNVPLDKLKDVEASGKGSNIEHQSIAFRSDCIAPWAMRWEQELARKLLREDEKDAGYKIELNLDVLLRADTVTRYQALVNATGGPIMSLNEARKIEGMPPVEGGESVMHPLNMFDVGGDASDPRREELVDDMLEDAGVQNNASPLLADVEKRIQTKEHNAIKRAIKKYKNPGEYAEWVEDFFSDKHKQLIDEQIQPIRDAFGIELKDFAEEWIKDASVRALNAHGKESILDTWVGKTNADKE